MRSRILFGLVVAALLAGCSDPTSPMQCQGNPRCKPDLKPEPPKLSLEIAAPGERRGDLDGYRRAAGGLKPSS